MLFKLIKWFLIVCVLLVIGVVVLIYASLDHLVKSVVETQGTKQLTVPLTLDGVSLGLIHGSISLSNLAMGSPQGFTSPKMLSVGGLSVDTGGISNLRNKPIRLSQIRIDSPTLVIEQSGGKLNFKQLMDNLPQTPSDKTPASQSPSDETKLIIDDMAVNNSHVIIRAGIPGMSKDIDIPLLAVDVKNVGNADGAANGVAVRDVVTTLINEMTKGALNSEKLPPEVKILLTGNLADIQGKLAGSAQDRLTALTGKIKIPANVNGLLNNALNKNGGSSGQRQRRTKPARPGLRRFPQSDKQTVKLRVPRPSGRVASATL